MGMDFWKGFLSQDRSDVHTPYAMVLIAFCLATPIFVLSVAVIIEHIFIRGQKLDPPTVQLLLGLLGSATGGVVSAGVSMFSRTTYTNVTGVVGRANIAPPGE